MKKQQTKQLRGRPSTFNRNETLKRAMNCYWNDGVYEISINELCKRIQISKPTLYREYKNEDGLLHDVLVHYQEEVLAPMIQLVSQHSSLKDKIDSLLTFITTPKQGPSGCLLVQLMLIPERLGNKTLTLVHKIQEQVLDVYQSWIVEAFKKVEVKQHFDPYFLADYICAQVTSIIIRMNLKEDPLTLRAQGQLALSMMYI